MVVISSTLTTGRRVKVLISQQPKAHVAVKKTWLRTKLRPLAAGHRAPRAKQTVRISRWK
jgi:hypothetical protein